ncbi:MAG: copper-binding transcription factor [Candelina submexicana]|nr:MAG: copper-binding transcription factor [Candelina submexicana]
MYPSTHRRTPSNDKTRPKELRVNMALPKGATFHSPTTPDSEASSPTFNVPSMPKRAQTCPKTLEDVIAAGEKRMAALIGSFNRSLSGIGPASPASEETLRLEELPVPRLLLDATVSNLDCMDVDSMSPGNPTGFNGRAGIGQRPTRQIRKHHTSDSGIGSTVSGTIHSKSESGDCVNNPVTGLRPHSRSGAGISATHSSVKSGRTSSAITRSLSNLTASEGGHEHVLSDHAKDQIREHIVLPILRQAVLKDFHPLIKDVPHRIGRREITCLRDLEKTLIYLAPEWSVSKTSYLSFCETSIQCIHTTVDNLNERDQRRPSDRPYTNGYFLDLVEQIRQYASMMEASKRRAAAGEELGEMDYSPDETVSLHGGLSQTGRAAQLVRVKNGKTFPINATDLHDAESLVDDELSSSHAMKRSLSEDSYDEDGVRRSMARRRKSAQGSAKDVPQTCRECNKEFKRPCDLTKHEKTHSRPWKCVERTCKYYEYGWPTEKECARHINDKHSDTPALYECQFRPCIYKSKRESNCKQHMEKAHGWTYVRSKNNGRNPTKAPAKQSPYSPQVNTPSYSMDASTPMTRDASSTFGASDGAYSLNGSISPSDGIAPYPTNSLLNDDMNGYGGQLGSSRAHFDFNDYPGVFGSNDLTEYSPASDFQRHSFDATNTSLGHTPAVPAFENSLAQEEPELTLDNVDWSTMNHNPQTYNAQLFTPAHSVDAQAIGTYSRNPSMQFDQPVSNHIPSLSPGAQGNLMLYTPHSENEFVADEGFEEFGKPTGDFPLFSGGESSMSSAVNEGMFPEMVPYGSHMPQEGWSQQGGDILNQLDFGDLPMDGYGH